ncbi:sensor histidine kinase [Streptomyces sp. NPDC056480]|uniref:sensor histidine kinase n=1 Tax=Streptomyces sp. NPDC056480 TaxID=3345833 RepID=UPI00368CAB49
MIGGHRRSGGDASGEPPAARWQHLPQRLAIGMLMAVLTGFGVMGMLNILDAHQSEGVLGASLATFGCLFLLQLFHSAQRTRALRERYGRLTLGLQAVLTFGPLPLYGVMWGGMAGFLAGSILLLVRGRLAWVLFVSVALVNGGSALASGYGPVDLTYIVISTLLTGLIVFCLSRLVDLIIELERKRAESAWLAATEERLRIARDLHDLLGYSLSAITLKSELVHRLIGLHDDRARDEIVEVLDISREALADVRTVARGYRDMVFDDELVAVQKVLTTADVDVSVEKSFIGELGKRREAVLATVLREAVTNMLRHSTVRHCRISLRRRRGVVALTVSNDGSHPGRGLAAVPYDGGNGSGLANLAERLAGVDGTLNSSQDGEGWFHLIAECPIGSPADTAPKMPAPPLARGAC